MCDIEGKKKKKRVRFSCVYGRRFASASRDMQKVLCEDRERLRQMQKSQPRFSQDQKKELMEVHPWLLKGCLPKAVDVKVGL